MFFIKFYRIRNERYYIIGQLQYYFVKDNISSIIDCLQMDNLNISINNKCFNCFIYFVYGYYNYLKFF